MDCVETFNVSTNGPSFCTRSHRTQNAARSVAERQYASIADRSTGRKWRHRYWPYHGCPIKFPESRRKWFRCGRSQPRRISCTGSNHPIKTLHPATIPRRCLIQAKIKIETIRRGSNKCSLAVRSPTTPSAHLTERTTILFRTRVDNFSGPFFSLSRLLVLKVGGIQNAGSQRCACC